MNKKTILVIITGILLAVAGAGVGATFSRYTSEATATPEAKVAKWHVNVGGEDISNGETKQFNAVIKWEDNENVQPDYIAPGSKGTITFIIDADRTQVPIDYSIVINTKEISSHSQISIKQVTASPHNEKETTLNADDAYTFNGGIDLADVSKPVTITINLEWENQEDKNADDTSLGATAPILSLPITFTASQRIVE